MPVLTNAQIATLQKTLAVTNNVLPRLEMLESLANINPAIKPRVQELRAQREYLAQLATAALEIERQLGGNVNVPPTQTSAGVSYAPPPPITTQYTPPAPSYPAYQPPVQPEFTIGTPVGPDVPFWVPSENVPRGTRRLIQKMPILGMYGTPTPEQQQAANQYGWEFITVQGDAFYAVKQ